MYCTPERAAARSTYRTRKDQGSAVTYMIWHVGVDTGKRSTVCWTPARWAERTAQALHAGHRTAILARQTCAPRRSWSVLVAEEGSTSTMVDGGVLSAHGTIYRHAAEFCRDKGFQGFRPQMQHHTAMRTISRLHMWKPCVPHIFRRPSDAASVVRVPLTHRL